MNSQPSDQNPYAQYPSPPYTAPPPRPPRPFYRPSNGRMLGGVCAAIADHFGWDRNLVRILTVASLLLPGPQVLAYLVAWVIVPDEQTYWARRGATPSYAAQPPHPTPGSPL